MGEMIGRENPVVALYLDLRNELINEIVKIGNSPNFVNLTICKIREYNRKWEKEVEGRNIPIKKDGFLKLIKKDFDIEGTPQALRNALKYL